MQKEFTCQKAFVAGKTLYRSRNSGRRGFKSRAESWVEMQEICITVDSAIAPGLIFVQVLD
jgi:hypothetical protein